LLRTRHGVGGRGILGRTARRRASQAREGVFDAAGREMKAGASRRNPTRDLSPRVSLPARPSVCRAQQSTEVKQQMDTRCRSRLTRSRAKSSRRRTTAELSTIRRLSRLRQCGGASGIGRERRSVTPDFEMSKTLTFSDFSERFVPLCRFLQPLFRALGIAADGRDAHAPRAHAHEAGGRRLRGRSQAGQVVALPAVQPEVP
jgi:hypothetical protein